MGASSTTPAGHVAVPVFIMSMEPFWVCPCVIAMGAASESGHDCFTYVAA